MENQVTREIELDAAPDEVWEALTDPEQLAGWLGAEAEIERAPGRALAIETEDGPREGWVEEYEPARRLSIWWSARRRGCHPRPVRPRGDRGRDAPGGHGNAAARSPRAGDPRRPGHARARLMAATDSVFDALSDGTRRGLLLVAGGARAGNRHRAGRRAAGDPPGREQAPGRAGGGRAGDRRALGPRGALPPHARAAVRRDGVDGRRRRAVGQAAGGPQRRLDD